MRISEKSKQFTWHVDLIQKIHVMFWFDIYAHNHWRTMRHKKIPGKKCKGFKDPEGQQAKRQEQLQQKVIQVH